ncbi:MAG: hypothetical protein ACRCZQ_06640, partial [Bacteroidales bacterium]
MEPIQYNSDITSYKDPRINEYPAEIREKKRAEIRKERRIFKRCVVYAFLTTCLSTGIMYFFAFTMEDEPTVLNYIISVFISTLIIVSTYMHGAYLCMIKMIARVPLINNEELKYYGVFDFRNEWIQNEFDVFKQFDDKKIVIDATVPGRFGYPIMIVFMDSILFFLGVYPFSDLIDPNIAFGENMGLLVFYAIHIIVIIHFRLYTPKCIVVFDRESKTITIPGKWVFSKEETLPYSQAIIMYGSQAHVEMSEFRGDERVVIANPNKAISGISMRFYGRTNGYCFARFISE